MDKPDTIKILLNMGLNTEESELIFVLLANKECSITKLEHLTTIPRSSIYRYLNSLKEKNLILENLTSNGSLYSISDLSILNSRFNEEEEVLKSKRSQFDGLLKQLNQNKPSSIVKTTEPKVLYYEGKQGIRQLMWNTLKTKTFLRVYTNARRKDFVGEKWLKDYCLEFCKNDLHEKVLVAEEYSKSAYNKDGSKAAYFSPVLEYIQRSDERTLKNSDFKIQGEAYIYNNVFAFYTWESDIHVGCEIISDYLAISQSSIFDCLWEETNPKDAIK